MATKSISSLPSPIWSFRFDRTLTVRPKFFCHSVNYHFVSYSHGTSNYSFPLIVIDKSFRVELSETSSTGRSRRNLTSLGVAMLQSNPVVNDFCVTALSGGVALSLLQFWGEIAKRGILDQKLNRKLVHISVGLVFMLFWPLFSYQRQAAILAALIPGINIIRMLIVGLGLWKDEATVKSMSRYGDYRELLKGPLYYATTITLASAIFWRTSPIAIVAICNLCAGDGMADIVGRRFGKGKLPYNRNKSYAGSIAMATAGFIASVGYMYYFSLFGFLEGSWGMVIGFLIVSIATALVESLPISSKLDDNLTVPLTSVLVNLDLRHEIVRKSKVPLFMWMQSSELGPQAQFKIAGFCPPIEDCFRDLIWNLLVSLEYKLTVVKPFCQP